MAVVEREAAEAVVSEAAPPAAAPAPAKASHSGSSIWLNTEHWLLMTVTPAYANLFARLHQRNGEHFKLAMSLEPGMDTAEFWEPILASQQQACANGSGLFLVGFHKKAPKPEIGCVISFSGIVHDEFKACWLGYRLDSTLEGRGLMHSAVAPAISAVFERYELHRIMASHQPENLRSARLLRRLGFGIEGYSRDFMRINGEWRDNVLLALIEPGG